MNKKQKNLLIRFITVMLATTLAVLGIINFRDWVNRSEAFKAMQYMGEVVKDYRKEHSIAPAQSYINRIKDGLPGSARLGNLKYRAQWIEFGASEDEILAYTEKNFSSPLVKSGYIVLRLDGRVEWMQKEEFKKLLASQQSSAEREITH